MTKRSADPISSYLAPLPREQREALGRLRALIHAAAPDAEECISYGIPAFRLNGLLVAFGAAKHHCAFYPCSGRTILELKDALARFDTSKGTIRFQPEKPLPAALVKKIVKMRVAQNKARR